MIKLKNVKPGMVINRTLASGYVETIYVKYVGLKRNRFWSGPYMIYYDIDDDYGFGGSCIDPEELVSVVSEKSRKKYVEKIKQQYYEQISNIDHDLQQIDIIEILRKK